MSSTRIARPRSRRATSSRIRSQREWIAQFGDRRRLEIRIGQAGRSRSQRDQRPARAVAGPSALGWVNEHGLLGAEREPSATNTKLSGRTAPRLPWSPARPPRGRFGASLRPDNVARARTPKSLSDRHPLLAVVGQTGRIVSQASSTQTMTFPSDGAGPDDRSPARRASNPAPRRLPFRDAPGYSAPDLPPIGASGGPARLPGCSPRRSRAGRRRRAGRSPIPNRSRQASRRGVARLHPGDRDRLRRRRGRRLLRGARGGGGIGLPQAGVSFPPQFAVYEQAWQILQQNYVDPKALDPTTLTYGSISGLLSAVGDTDHTRFLSPQDLADENSSLSGSVVGIGAEMSTVNGAADHPVRDPGQPGREGRPDRRRHRL